MRLLQRMAESLQGMASFEKQPSMEGRSLHIILSSTGLQKAKVAEKKRESENAKIENP